MITKERVAGEEMPRRKRSEKVVMAQQVPLEVLMGA